MGDDGDGEDEVELKRMESGKKRIVAGEVWGWWAL